MGKDSKKHLVGQPIFKQINKIIPKDKFDELVIYGYKNEMSRNDGSEMFVNY
jgi:hypothetical protein